VGSPGQLHRGSTVVLSLVMVVLGVALAVQAVAGHGGIVPLRLLLGVLFIAGGGLRLWLERRRGQRR
jgi:hypothetical protein